MSDYKKLYYSLAGKVADAIEMLVKAQQEAEEEYLDLMESEDAQND